MRTEPASFHRYVNISALIYTHIYTNMCIHIHFIYSFFPRKEINYTVIMDNKYQTTENKDVKDLPPKCCIIFGITLWANFKL